MDRRSFLRLLALGIVGHELDLDRLLWTPGEKTIFIPDNPTLSMSQIVALELERMIPKIQTLFERDDIFYTLLKKDMPLVSSREMRVPLQFEKK